MREHPDLEQLKRQARELLQGFLGGEPGAAAEVHAHYHGAHPDTFVLAHAQLTLARAYGFDNWAKLKAYVDGATVRRLAEAVTAGDAAQVQAMLRARPELADMQMSYGDERRPIHFAVIARSPAMVRILMRHGANPHAGVHPNRDATTASTMARERGYDELLPLLAKEASAPAHETATASEAPDEAREAVISGDLEWLRSAHAAGPLVNRVRWDGGGLLTAAVEHEQPEILEFLLDCGFDPNERTSEGEGDWVAYTQGMPLWRAAANGQMRLAELLLRRGADPNVHADSSGSPVYSAFSHRQWEMAELLERHGGIVTADIAGLYRRTDIARTLVKSDAAELLHFGACGGAVEIVELALAQLDWAPDDPRWRRALAEPLSFWHHIPWLYAGNKAVDREGYLQCFRRILGRCGPNHAGAFGRTPLHEVASMGSWVTAAESAAFARVLLDAGAKVDVRDQLLESSPLGWACRWGRLGVVEALLNHGADPLEADAQPWARPLAWAEKRGHTEIAALLRSR